MKESEIIETLSRVASNLVSSETTKVYVLNAVVKLCGRFSDSSKNAMLKILAQFKTSISQELQQRACEYAAMASSSFDNLRFFLDADI